jgi:hypothetical protein
MKNKSITMGGERSNSQLGISLKPQLLAYPGMLPTLGLNKYKNVDLQPK